jgi:hypothetical protein
VFALFLIVLLGVSALTVDYGTWLLAKRGYQNVSDAAALAGVAQLSRPRTDPCTAGKTKPICAREAAWTSVKQQLNLTTLNPVAQSASDTSDVAPYREAGYRIWVDTPPTAAGAKYGGAYTSNGTIFVRVERESSAYFGRVFGQGDPTVSAWSTAGLFPNRFAVIALCKSPSCPQAESIKLAGGGSSITVIDGDVGGNWGLKVTSTTGPGLILSGESDAYFVDPTCGTGSTYNCPPAINGGISDGTAAKAALRLPIPVADPAYALPVWIDNATAVPDRPDPTITTGTPINASSSTVSCAAGSTRLGPGSYDSIKLGNGDCVILDPTFGLTAGQHPGIFRIKKELSIGNGAFVIGDGVSIFFDPTVDIKKFTVGNSGGIVVNNGNATANQSKGAWTSRAVQTWSTCPLSLPCVPTYNASANGIGMAFYIRPAASGTTSIFNMSGGTGLAFRGVLYGPKDAVGIGGNSAQASAGQIVGYTIRYNGSTTLTQTYEGPSDERPYLLEPTLGQ